MPRALQVVSNRFHGQVRVKGPCLARELGYGLGVRVVVSDATDPSRPSWRLTVSNRETATLTCRETPLPEWIQPGVRVAIEVTPAGEVAAEPRGPVAIPAPPITSPAPAQAAGPGGPTIAKAIGLDVGWSETKESCGIAAYGLALPEGMSPTKIGDLQVGRSRLPESVA